MQALSICLHTLNSLKYRDLLMTSTSPELLRSTAERVRHVDIPVAARRSEPNGKSGQAEEATEDKKAKEAKEDKKAKEAKEAKDAQQDKQNTFDLQFSHSRELLHFIARRILNCVQE